MTTIRRRFKVKSSNIKSIGFDPYTKILEVVFLSSEDTTYSYQNISPVMYCEMMNAESIGEHFASQIKPHKVSYPFTKSMRSKK